MSKPIKVIGSLSALDDLLSTIRRGKVALRYELLTLCNIRLQTVDLTTAPTDYQEFALRLPRTSYDSLDLQAAYDKCTSVASVHGGGPGIAE